MTIPAVPSAIARSGGVPSRPASAMTTPVTVTVTPTFARRASAIVGTEVGGGVFVGPGVGDGVALGPGVPEGAIVGDGVAVAVGSGVDIAEGVGSGVGEGSGVGLGVGSGRTLNSPGSVACSRYPARPVPLLSR